MAEIIGSIIGAIVIVYIITTLLREYLFKNQKRLKRDVLAIVSAIVICTLIYLVVSKSLSLTYFIGGVIVFLIVQLRSSRKTKKSSHQKYEKE